jgi:hypothetical protein
MFRSVFDVLSGHQQMRTVLSSNLKMLLVLLRRCHTINCHRNLFVVNVLLCDCQSMIGGLLDRARLWAYWQRQM